MTAAGSAGGNPEPAGCQAEHSPGFADAVRHEPIGFEWINRMPTLRDRLQYLFGKTWTPAEFDEQWAKFAARTDHTVRMICPPPLPEKHRWLIPHMNCFAYSLGLQEIPKYRRWIREYHALYILNGQFVVTLIEKEWLRDVADADFPMNSLVVYYNGDTVTHCGLIVTDDKRVRSKFNVNEFYEHGLLEVQTSFGTPKRYFELPTNEVRMQIIDELYAASGAALWKYDIGFPPALTDGERSPRRN